MPETVIRSLDELRRRFGEPSPTAARKSIPVLDKHCRAIIAASPFLCMATADMSGRADVSPRGDQPGFVQVENDTTLLIPDRTGNNLLDSMSNLVANPEIGLIFMVPGMDETLRVNGRAELVEDAALSQRFAVNGKAPKIVIRVTVREAFLHCARAFRRARLWDPAARIDRAALPTLACMLNDMAALNLDVPAYEKRYDDAMKQLY